jgi:extracellular factor (EF) 3-hydroxypalmitic acid methyl ester biosynthesis protein
MRQVKKNQRSFKIPRDFLARVILPVIAVSRRKAKLAIEKPLFKINAVKERRDSVRISIPFPVEVSGRVIGKTINLSEGGLCLALEKPMSSARIITTYIDLPFSKTLLKTQGKIIWSYPFAKDNRYFCGINFLKLTEKEILVLKEALFKYRLLNSSFIFLTENLRSFLFSIKKEFDQTDILKRSEESKIKFIEKRKRQVYEELDGYFHKLWEIIKEFDEEEYLLHQKYYQKMLGYLLLDLVEINRVIYQRPLGYPGDFFIMNYFYDFCEKYLGNSSYTKLLNNYTCNIPIAKDVVDRKDFFKQKIEEVINEKSFARVLSVGSGPARELIELVKEGKVLKPLFFDCVDSEEKALDYIRTEIGKIDPVKRQHLRLRLINRNLLLLLKLKNAEREFGKYDFIYSSGMFDYLSDKISKKMVENLYKLLDNSSSLIVSNANKDIGDHRAYYEMLGNWMLIQRQEVDMLDWVRGVGGASDIEFLNSEKKKSFLFLSIIKPSK